MFIQVCAEPWSGHHEVGPAWTSGFLSYGICGAPDVAVVMDRPAVHPVHVPDHLLSRYGTVTDEFHQRNGRSAQPERLRRPVVHLYVDVGVQVAAPRRMPVLAPYSLEVARNSAVFAGTGYEEVAPELEIESLQIRIACSGGIGLQPLVGGQILSRTAVRARRSPFSLRCG